MCLLHRPYRPRNVEIKDYHTMTVQTLQDELERLAVYRTYREMAESFWKENRKSGEIQEGIWPELTGDTLVGPGKIDFRGQLLYTIEDHFLHTFADVTITDQKNTAYTFLHLGPKLSGHAGIVHGGLLATLLDELTCRVAFQNFESKKAVTANLNINYIQPCWADTFVLVKCELETKKGRKATARGRIYKVHVTEPITGPEQVETKENLLTEATLLAIEPRWIDKLQNRPN